ncbi:hypothetical protein QRX50_07175 [Amycolatopsis carbonis]|uniref:Uncharacterized protein n=1 Tax=Amycolatopsis carbonis TaxID=715471 RepID=A0A9Y2MYY2_9PSEU|nr:hypothetical protein [Amycolatopsis sp. 2-15]WIX80544.1 hypothetical protein QRX50_07175 [Amycolatopsis sp. 2-15]
MVMPSSKAVFGYDVIGSSSVEDDQLETLRSDAKELVEAALDKAGIDLATQRNYSGTGDGSLSAFSEPDLPALIDTAYELHCLLYNHNRRHLPTIQVRLAAHSGPVVVSDREHFQRPTIDLARLLDAKEFKALVKALNARLAVTAALIISDQAYRDAVKGRHTKKLTPHDFARLEVENKEFSAHCWVWAPGLDPDALPEIDPSPTAAPAATRPQGEIPSGTSSQHIGGSVYGVAIGGNNSGSITSNIGYPGGQR